jgi:regulatory protein
VGRSAHRFERRPPDSSDDEFGGLRSQVDPESEARAVVLRRLTLAARTRAELAEGLVERGFEIEVVDRVLDRFEEVGLIDDAEFAGSWVASRHRTRGAARSVLRQELRNKGVDDELAEAALATITAEDELIRARALIARKLISLRCDDREQATRRLVAYLRRRGYGGSIAFTVVAEALDLHDVQIDG